MTAASKRLQRGTFLLWLGGTLLAIYGGGCLWIARWLDAHVGEMKVPGQVAIECEKVESAGKILMLHFGVPGGIALVWGLWIYLGWRRSEAARVRREAVARVEAERFLREMREEATPLDDGIYGDN